MDNGRIMVKHAEIFAVAAHGKQQYGFHPYYKHLKDVVDIVSEYGTYAQTLAWLHDVLEDANCVEEQLIHVFGMEVARDVRLLSDPPGASRHERKRLLNLVLGDPETPRPVLMVKAADRLANVRHSCLGNESMVTKYRDEHEAFRLACYRDRLCDKIWDELDARISGTWRQH